MLYTIYRYLHNYTQKGRETLAKHAFWGIDFSEETKEKIYHKGKEIKEE